tara:strand:- start:14286 stop:15569 length:1284 start_codon:yes stop_codon:yes gene_type:complete
MPEDIVNRLCNEYGEQGLVWLDGNIKNKSSEIIIGVNPKQEICTHGIAHKNNPFNKLNNIGEGYWIGWLSYEAGAFLEPKNPWRLDEMATLWIGKYDPIIRFNNLRKKIFIEGTNQDEIDRYYRIISEINAIKEEENINDRINSFNKITFDNWRWLSNKNEFESGVEKIKDLIKEGDIFQANLSTACIRNSINIFSPLSMYLKIRKNIIAPFSGLINANNRAIGESIISTSPERFISLNKTNEIETRPIKGTRPRSKDIIKDNYNAIELVTSTKDRAENIMIVDLLRNDLSKVSKLGSIWTPELLKLERYHNVHHLTSVIKSTLKEDKNWVDLLKSCWPGGSITGAPKLRACERLFELEKIARGPYCGSFLKKEWDGSFDSNILIRSILIKDQKIRIHAGCGIVSDSIPSEEIQELKWKIEPLIKSI